MGEIRDSFQVIKTLFRATKIVQQVKAASLPPSLTSLSFGFFFVLFFFFKLEFDSWDSQSRRKDPTLENCVSSLCLG